MMWRFSMVGAFFITQYAMSATLSMKDGQFDFHFTKAECDYLTVNAPTSPDVAYQQDDDVEVASDIKVKAPDHIDIPISPVINDSPFFGSIHNDFLDKAQMGNVKVDVKNGRIWYNGQPLFDANQAVIDAYCQPSMMVP